MPALIAGLTLGFSAGISPGPLMTLVMTTSLARGFRAGLRVAVAPLITDAPIILLTTLLFSALPSAAEMALAIVGGLFVIYLGVDTIRNARHAQLVVTPAQPQPTQDLWRNARHAQLVVTPAQPQPTQDLWRGALVNMLSPHPWLFWISVGSPLLVTFWRESVWYALAFLLGFYVLLIGSKVGLALLVASGRRYLTDAWYRRILLVSGALLIFFGLLLLWAVVK